MVGAVPGFMGYKMMKDVIEAGKNIVDISFYSEDAFGLDELAKEKGVVAVMDCGVAPGMGNIIFGHHDSKMEITDYECLVGGLPEKREWPYEYQAVFSPIDVIEEYIRPARYVQNSQMITKEALSDTELIEFDEIGTLESWNSDGLRSLIKTMAHVPNMIEKTLRYPGCVEYLKVLRASGFFSYEELEINGTMVRPVDKTAKLLGLPYPGGPALAALAKKGQPGRFTLPRPMVNRPGLDFSFSGLKTAVRTLVSKETMDEQTTADVAHAFEKAVVDTLAIKCKRAMAQTGLKRLVVAGGVSANETLRSTLKKNMEEHSVSVYYPRHEFCTDNGAMIAFAGCKRLEQGLQEPLAINVKARWPLEEI